MTTQRLIQFLILIFVGLTISSCKVQKKTARLGKSSGDSTTEARATKRGSRPVTAHYAELLNVSEKAINPALYQFIDQWMGRPHRMGGMTFDGIDCSGFVTLAYQQVYQKNLPRTSRDMAENVVRKYDYQLREGDLVFFSFGGKAVDHVGIYLHNDRFVHVSTKAGVVISNLKDPWYYKYLTRCGTPKG